LLDPLQRGSIELAEEEEEVPRLQSPPLRAEDKVLESKIPRRFTIFC
jgi:hypothetical protein